ncbi:myosin-2 heavy chain-like isoform X2 [Bradysia coprophila]|uniref:myosin-2 heavy chain-like isoform X2 n=1 Tax=Bradysia coprophila TaxID=38358 RepID=UPI00187D9033|nr:myosin-2 heavy chain-like isoform X2 [Bradysia coprophila]
MNNNSNFSQISAYQRSDIHSTLNEFNKLFEDQLNSINSQDSDSMKTKVQIYEEWVKRLLEEITTLVDCIQEMEKQTAHGLDNLTSNLNKACMPDERVKALQNDLNATVEIIRRARVYGQWNTEGIQLKHLRFTDIFGDRSHYEKHTYLEFERPSPQNPNFFTLNIEMNAELIEGDGKGDSEKQLSKTTSSPQAFPTASFIHELDTDHANIINDARINYAEQEMLFKNVQNRNAELMDEIERLKKENQQLVKGNLDTRVLVEEVAVRHDEIQKLKSENISLEEQLKKQNQNMCFKDQIIKELRKDCKKLSSSTPPMSTKIVQSTGSSELSRNLEQSDNNDSNDDIILEKSYNRKTDITNRLLEIFNFVQSSLQPSEYVHPNDAGVLLDYMPSARINDTISEEDLNTALMSFAARMNSLDKENAKLQAENEKLKEDLTEKIKEADTVIQMPTVEEAIVEKNLNSVVQEITQMDRHLSDGGSLFASSNVDKLTSQVAELRIEIESKNKLVSEKDSIIASLIECGILKDRELNDLRIRTCPMERDSCMTCNDKAVDKHLTTVGLMNVNTGDIGQLANLMVDLQQEIESKDKLLKDKDELIVDLRKSESSKTCELLELRKKIESDRNRNEETVSNLRDALDIHIKTINQQQLGNNHLENKIKDLQLYISNIDRNYVLLQEKCSKIQSECNDQLTTISNLRSVVEEYSKRPGVYHESNNDSLPIDTFIFSEQISDLFSENIQYEKKISLLQDDNLFLRGEMYLWSQDYSYLEDKYLDHLSETRKHCENISSIDAEKRNLKCNQPNDCKSILTKNTTAVIHYIKAMEDNIIDELKNYTPSIEDFRSFKQYVEELSSQLNVLSNESKFSQKLIEDSTLLFESFQHVQHENDNLKRKYELSQQQIQLFESEANELRSQNTTLECQLNDQKAKMNDQMEQIKRIENDKNSLTVQLNQNSLTTTKITEQSQQRHQKDIDELLISHQEYQKAKDMSVQLTNDVAQLKITIAELNQEILRQSMVLEKQKDDRYTMSKQLESAFEITEKLKFTIDSNLKSISHLQEENEKLKEELNQSISTIEKRQTDYNAMELEMINKNDTLQQSIDEHIKARRISDKSVLDMSVQNQKLNQQNDDLVGEIAHLKDEIDRFKRQIKSLESNNSLINDMQADVGHVRSQLEKLLVNLTEKEAELTTLRKQNSALNQQCATHVNGHRLLETKLNKVIEKCKEMKQEYDLLKSNYENLYEIKEKLTESLSVSQNAIGELKERENLANHLLAKQDEHIRTLLHDRSALKMKMDQMHRDMIILNSRLDTGDYQSYQYSPSSETVTRKTKLIKYRSVPSLNTPDETLQSIQRIRRKIYETRSFWQNGMDEAFK